MRVLRTALALLCPAAAVAQEPAPDRDGEPPLWEVDANPQRPSFTTNATTTRPGYLELEAGLAWDEDRFDTPLLFKVGLDPRTEVFVGISPYVEVDTPGGDEASFGDTLVGGKHRFFEGPHFDSAFLAALKLPTADDDVGTGDPDLELDLILSSLELERGALDFNAGLTLADFDDPIWATGVAWSAPIGERTSFYGELFASFDHEADQDVVVTDWGVSWRANRSFVLDAALAFGLSDDAPDVQLLVGFTKVLGRVFAGFRDLTS